MTETSTGSTGTAQTHTVGSGTATVTYDVHGDLTRATPERPALLMIGSPMDAAGFSTLRSHFTDRPVVTYDPVVPVATRQTPPPSASRSTPAICTW
jgi:hypothetical protein